MRPNAAMISSAVCAAFNSVRDLPVTSQPAISFKYLARSPALVLRTSSTLTTTVTEDLEPLGLLQTPIAGLFALSTS